MKKIIYILILIHILHSSAFSQSSWFSQNPYPDGQDINSIFFFNDATGYISGSSGRILKTTDGCQNWTYLNSNINQAIYKIYFLDISTGFLISSNQFYKTTNSGNSWTSKMSAYGYNFITFYFFSFNTGYISCSDGSILRTTNCGNNWNQISSTSEGLKDIIFIDSLDGFGISNNDKIFSTLDGGLSWNYISFSSGDTSVYLKSICFPVNYVGYTQAQKSYHHYPYPSWDRTEIYKTTNYGLNWNIVNIIWELPKAMIFTSLTNGYLSTDSKIYKTTNGGINYTSVYNGNYTTSFFFSSSNYGFSGGPYGEFVKTTNGGDNWIRLSRLFTRNSIKSSYFINNNTGYVVGAGGLIAKTNDAGNNWMILNTNTNAYFNSIYFCSEHTGYAVGFAKDTIFKTTNDGINWQRQSSSTNAQSLYCIQFVNNLTGYASGYPGIVIKTTNAGINWISLPTSVNMDLLSLYFIDALNGFVVSNYGNILKTTNGGNNFTYQSFGSTYFWCVKFLNSNTGFVSTANSSENIYKTTNAGYNWIPYSTGSNQQSNYVNFIDENTGFVVGNSIYKTTNGGVNWFVPFYFSSGWFLWNISICNPNTIYVVGDLGTILKSTNGGGTFIANVSLAIPEKNYLSQNYPNPFNSISKIKYQIAKTHIKNQKVQLIIYNSLGQEIEKLVNEEQEPGTYEVTFDGSNLPSGVYFYQLRTGNYTETKKLILLK